MIIISALKPHQAITPVLEVRHFAILEFQIAAVQRAGVELVLFLFVLVPVPDAAVSARKEEGERGEGFRD